jgi:hypothetical protein
VITDEIAHITKSNNEKQQRIKVIESQLKNDSDKIPLPILQAQHDKLLKTVNELQANADAMKANDGPKVDPKEIAKLQQNREKFHIEFKKRKRLCMNIIDTVMEGEEERSFKS